jgi:hypothetical protein
MQGRLDSELMLRGAAARRLIADGEDPVRMLLQVVWPGYDWAESALRSRFTACPVCVEDVVGCAECGGTRLVTVTRRKLLAIEALADCYALSEGVA